MHFFVPDAMCHAVNFAFTRHTLVHQ